MNKDKFLENLIGLPKEEINRIIKEKGKRPKLIKPCVFMGIPENSKYKGMLK